jgi:DNA-binding response OmpR family regulator
MNAKHIVLVDDDDNIRRILGDVLRKKRYEVTAAPDWDTMIEALQPADQGKEEKPKTVDLFLLDIFMAEGINGLAMAKELRQRGYTYPVCFISARNCSLDEERRLTATFPNASFMQKPITPKALLRRVAELTT